MRKRKKAFTTVMAVGMSTFIFFNTSLAFASPVILKKGMEGTAVTSLQDDLNRLGFFNMKSTGYYGDITESAVRQLQKQHGYAQDGIAGPDTFSLVDKLKRELDNSASRASSGSSILKKGMRGDGVYSLQNDLKKLGYFNQNATGYYGDITVSAVVSLQKSYGYTQDGIAGPATFGLINRLLGRESNSSAASRGEDPRSGSNTSNSENVNYLVSWGKVNSQIFTIGKVATVTDIETSLSFKIKRTYGYNHADCETLTAEDTKTMKKIYGGQWSWNRRAIIVDVDGVKIAASMAGMPHAGTDGAKANTYVKSRSGGYGAGTNLDTVKGNDMDGHFDIHFSGSKTHGTSRVDGAHQSAAKRANEWAKKNF
jgi:peptidoglycan hydrolase-like protein with peptidoglycan-binding domain